MGYIHEYKARMNQVKAGSGQPRRGCVAQDHLNIFQAAIGHKASRHRNGVAVSFDADHQSRRSDALREQVQGALRSTTEIDRPITQAKAYTVEQPSRLLS